MKTRGMVFWSVCLLSGFFLVGCGRPPETAARSNLEGGGTSLYDARRADEPPQPKPRRTPAFSVDNLEKWAQGLVPRVEEFSAKLWRGRLAMVLEKTEALHRGTRELLGSLALVRDEFDGLQAAYDLVLASIRTADETKKTKEKEKEGEPLDEEEKADLSKKIKAEIRQFVIKYEACADSLKSLEDAWRVAPRAIADVTSELPDPEGKIKTALEQQAADWEKLGKEFKGLRWMLPKVQKQLRAEVALRAEQWLSDLEQATAFAPTPKL